MIKVIGAIIVIGLIYEFAKKYKEVSREQLRRKTKDKQVWKILGERTWIPKRYFQYMMKEGREETLSHAEDLLDQVDTTTRRVPWVNLVALAVYMQYRKDCEGYLVNDQSATERLCKFHIADYRIRKDAEENLHKVIRRITGFII